MITPAISTGLAGKSEALSPERRELREAAQGFEAIMIRRMLESARASGFAEDAPLTGGGLKQFEKMRDEHFAEVAAGSGAFGFARSIEEQLAQYVDGQGGM
ncbi:flagellar biosynthesis protein FlgJ [Erythrobacter insulae]|uniref:Flagellar biosynthesis protein FlgJ n=1 Tax=Erythrobacter insulae TaxID=2584124 RepID=A0A547PAL5_9SPHN|nr:flagellar biosynthesis protein FlgJ [Erythrobacter insulae]TRD11074.1 flagellar biosynthesis protein FlgJ [Erythrobacter insulae]